MTMTTALSDLRPCPFCASGAVLLQEEQYPQYGGMVQTMFTVRCTECYGQIKRATPKDAVEAWNSRGGIPARELDELELQEAEDRMLFGEDEEE